MNDLITNETETALTPKQVCGARKRGTYDPTTGLWELCDRSVGLYANGRCKDHGGRNKSGADHYNFRLGNWSQSLPEGIRDRAEEFLSDPDLVSVRQQLALCNTREHILTDRLSSHEDPAVYSKLLLCLERIHSNWEKHQEDIDNPLYPQSIARYLQEARELTTTLDVDERTWKELEKLWETKRRLAETEQRLILAKQQTLTTLEAYTLIDAIVNNCLAFIPDPQDQLKLADIVDHAINRVKNRGADFTGPAYPIGRQ